MTDQLKLFDDTETLPLFSGTAPRAKVRPFQPPPGGQSSLPWKCGACRDTGYVIADHGHYSYQDHTRFCWCEAGQQARKDRNR